MYLTDEEEKLLESPNKTISKAMEILTALGKIYGAEKLIKIKSAHISGISYQNIGESGLDWLENLSGPGYDTKSTVKVKVTTTINPAGMDLGRWSEMGIDKSFHDKQLRIIKALEKIGAISTMTCTPYYLEKLKFGEHLAWAESSAVIYANSVIGAMTNRESGISAIASGIVGKTPFYGMHIKKNRAPNILIKWDGRANPSAAGLKIGNMLSNEIPLIKVDRKLSNEELKLMGAAMAATGNVPIFHVKGQTPEWNDFDLPVEKIEINPDDLEEFRCQPDLIALGCPHLSVNELKDVLKILENEGMVKKTLWLFTSRTIAQENQLLVRKLEEYGAKVFNDTCMVVSPATEKFECVMVNSGKALTYLPKLRGVKVSFGSTKECVREAVKP